MTPVSAHGVIRIKKGHHGNLIMPFIKVTSADQKKCGRIICRIFINLILKGLQFTCVGCEIACYTVCVRCHSLIAFVPPCGTNFAVFFEEFQGFYYTKMFVDIATQWQIVDRL